MEYLEDVVAREKASKAEEGEDPVADKWDKAIDAGEEFDPTEGMSADQRAEFERLRAVSAGKAQPVEDVPEEEDPPAGFSDVFDVDDDGGLP